MDTFKSTSLSASPDLNEGMEKKLCIGSNNANVEQETSFDALTILHGEQKDLVKLEQETGYLTDNARFFPELVWKHVLEKIHYISQIKDCSNASPFFGKVLEDKRKRKLVLPEVFSELGFRYYWQRLYDFRDPFYREENFHSIPWKATPKDEYTNLPNYLTGLWKCRVVCKSWNTAIEKLHQGDELRHFDFDHIRPSKHLPYLSTWATERFDLNLQEDGNSPQNFLKHFENTHYDSVKNEMIKNPFFGRSVHVKHVRHHHNSQRFLDGILEILRKYGQEIYYFRLDCFDAKQGADGLVALYKELKQMVQLMPTLKVLKLFVGRAFYLQSHPRLLPNSAAEILALEEEMSINPFVELPDLKYLQTRFIPVPIFNEILSKNRHLTQLENLCLDFHGGYEIFNNNLPNLTKLSLTATREDFEQFEQCQFPMKLEKFYLYFALFNGFPRFERIFGAMEAKLDRLSLSELVLKVPWGGTVEEWRLVLDDTLNCRLNFPKVKKVKIVDAPMEICLDFLLPCKNWLEELVIHYDKQARPEQLPDEVIQDFESRQQIDFLGFSNKMDESNISEELPSLKLLIIENEMNEVFKYEF